MASNSSMTTVSDIQNQNKTASPWTGTTIKSSLSVDWIAVLVGGVSVAVIVSVVIAVVCIWRRQKRGSHCNATKDEESSSNQYGNQAYDECGDHTYMTGRLSVPPKLEGSASHRESTQGDDWYMYSSVVEEVNLQAKESEVTSNFENTPLRGTLSSTDSIERHDEPDYEDSASSYGLTSEEDYVSYCVKAEDASPVHLMPLEVVENTQSSVARVPSEFSVDIRKQQEVKVCHELSPDEYTAQLSLKPDQGYSQTGPPTVHPPVDNISEDLSFDSAEACAPQMREIKTKSSVEKLHVDNGQGICRRVESESGYYSRGESGSFMTENNKTVNDELNPKEKEDETGKTDVETLQAELENVERPISSVTSGYDSAGSTMKRKSTLESYTAVDIDIEDSSGHERGAGAETDFNHSWLSEQPGSEEGERQMDVRERSSINTNEIDHVSREQGLELGTAAYQRPTDECEGAVVQYKYPKTDDPYLNKIHGKIRDYVQHLPREGYLTAKYLCIMTVGPKGGTLMFSGSQLFKLEIPPGAICQQNQLIYMFLHNPPKQSGVHRKVSYSPVVDCGPDGLKFKKPVKLTLPHCAVDTTDLQMLSRLEGSEWNDEKLSFTKIKNGDDDFITAEILHFTKFGVGKLSSVSSLSPKKFACVVYTKEDRARIHIMPICSEETFDSMVCDIGKENGEEGFAKSTMRTRFTYTPGNGDLRVIIHKENERDNILREDDIITEQLMMEMDWYQSIDFTMSDKKFSPTEEYMSAVILLQHNSYPNVSLAQLLVKLQKPDHRYLRQHTGECSYVQPEPLTQNPPDGSNYGDLSQESEGACAPLMRGRSTKCTVEQLCGFHGQLGKPCDCERMTGATSGYLSGASLKCFVDIDFGDNF